MQLFLKFIFGIKLYMFRAVRLSIIRSFSLCTQQWYMSYILCWLLASRIRIELCPDPVRKMYDTFHYCVYSKKNSWWWTENCPKHVKFYSKNKFEKLVHLVGFVIRIYDSWWWTENCPKHVEFYSKNKFEKLVHLVGFVVRNAK